MDLSVHNGYRVPARRASVTGMSENLRQLTRAIYNMDAVVQRVPADRWDDSSPCDGWTARDIVAHQVGVLNGVANLARGGEVRMPEMPDDRSDPLALWNRGRDDVLEALDHAGALHREGPYLFGPMTIDELIGVVKWDPLTHAWDLAAAVGVDHVADQELAERCLDTIGPMAATLRKWKLIGDEVEVTAGADAMSRFLGLIGRTPTSASVASLTGR